MLTIPLKKSLAEWIKIKIQYSGRVTLTGKLRDLPKYDFHLLVIGTDVSNTLTEELPMMIEDVCPKEWSTSDQFKDLGGTFASQW
jgi:hypothetical protein